jgi:Ca-activated chloride channel family protein
MQPAELPDLFDGDQLVVLGQYSGKDEVKLQLSGSFLGKDRTFDVAFDPSKASARNAYVGRLWATRKIGSLLEEIRLAGPGTPGGGTPDPRTKELVDEIVHLSTKWGILTEYTAFLAIEPGSELARHDETFRAQLQAQTADAAAPSPAAKVAENVQLRARQDRAGQGAVSQEMNLSYQVEAKCLDNSNVFWTKDLQKVQLDTVCQVQDKALFKRSNRWVEGRLIQKETEAPEQTVEFASTEYFQLCDELASQNRQGILAQDGDVYLMHNGKRVLVKGAQ